MILQITLFLSAVSTRRCLGKPNWPISDTKILVECSLPFICISEWCCVSKLHYVVKSSWHHNMIIRINKSGFFQIFSTFFWNQVCIYVSSIVHSLWVKSKRILLLVPNTVGFRKILGNIVKNKNLAKMLIQNGNSKY